MFALDLAVSKGALWLSSRANIVDVLKESGKQRSEKLQGCEMYLPVRELSGSAQNL